MPDKIFSDPELVQIYDAFDGDRGDLIHYINIAKEFNVARILDVGCGTGCFAEILAQHGFAVTGIDPAQASLDIAKSKNHAAQINYIHGTTAALPPMQADIAFMTGNVAQVFLDDEQWHQTLRDIHKALTPKGLLVFETRDSAQKAWENWNRDNSFERKNVEGVGMVAGWNRIDKVDLPFVSFTWTYHFEDADKHFESASTLRFRSKEELEESLTQCGFKVEDVRGAPDRPLQEFVFLARKS